MFFEMNSQRTDCWVVSELINFTKQIFVEVGFSGGNCNFLGLIINALIIVGSGYLALILQRSPFVAYPFFNFSPTSRPSPPLFLFPCFLTDRMIAPHLMCYFTWKYFGSKHVEPWYLSTRRLLFCLLPNKTSCFLRCKTWLVFFASTLIWYDTHAETKANNTHID